MTQLLDVSPSSFLLRNEINRRCRWKRTDVIHGNLIGTCNFFNSWESIVKTEDPWIKRKSVSLIFLSHEYPFYRQNERGLGTRLIFHYQIPQAVEEPEIFWIPPDFHSCRFRSINFWFYVTKRKWNTQGWFCQFHVQSLNMELTKSAFKLKQLCVAPK